MVKQISFEDFLGIELKMDQMFVHLIPLVSSSCFGKGNPQQRTIKTISFCKLPEDSPVLSEKFKKLVMRKFWEYQQKTLNSGLNSDDETYYSVNREPWEKKVLVIVNPKVSIVLVIDIGRAKECRTDL